MTANRRIFWNVVATYGRSLYSLAIGLFTARWVLMTLGEVDYGLLGVVGGMMGFISFFNGLMSTSISRFYAYSVGESNVAEDRTLALEECRRWFNVAVVIHMVVPLVSVLLCYPIGEWAVRHYLAIPPVRIDACVWVFRVTCLSCLVSMMTIPYGAMYTAKQEIAELTVYGFVTTTLNFFFLLYMVNHDGNWLVPYAIWTAFLSISPAVIIAVRSFSKYDECRIVFRYGFDLRRIKAVFSYAACRLMSSLAIMSAFQGVTIAVNKLLGPARNAAVAVSNNVSGHTLTLSGSLMGAFTPAITNAMGERNYVRAENLACRASLFSGLAAAFFSIPLCLEMNEVLRLWLKNPPAQTGLLCVLMIFASFLEKLAKGQCICVLAQTNIAVFQLCEALAFLIPLPTFVVFCLMGGGLEGVGIGFIALYMVDNIVKLYFAKRQCGHSIRRWFMTVLVPVLVVVGPSTLVGALPVLLLSPSFSRIVLTTACAEVVFIPLIWLFVLSSAEREMVKSKILAVKVFLNQ